MLSYLLTFLLPYFFTSLLVYFLTYLPTSSRIDLFHFQTGGRRSLPKLALVFWFILCCRTLCTMHVRFCCVCFSVSVLSQEICWEERPRNDLFCVGWDVKR